MKDEIIIRILFAVATVFIIVLIFIFGGEP